MRAIINPKAFIAGHIVLFYLASLIFPLSYQLATANETSNSLWVDKNIVVTKIQEADISAWYEGDGYGERDCQLTPFKLQKYRWRGVSLIEDKDRIINNCALQTPLGLISRTHIQFPGATYAQEVLGYAQLELYPAPSTRTVVVKHGHSTNYSSYATSVFYNLGGVGTSIISKLERKYQINSGAFPPPLSDESGKSLDIKSISFSRNGEWMAVLANNVQMRIHIPTQTVQTFAKSRALHGASYRLAISNDGRYVASVMSDTGSPVTQARIYDLKNCEPNRVTTMGLNDDVASGCQHQDILPVLKTANDTFRYVSHLRFSYDSNLISGLVNYIKPEDKPLSTGRIIPTGYQRVIISNKDYVQLKVEYLGLGDSFSSGEGDTIGDMWYEPGTDTSTNKCHIGRRSYPYLVAQQLGLHTGVNATPLQDSLFHSIACSGARVEDINSNSNEYLGQFNIKKENQDLEDVLINYRPGYVPQIEFIEKYKPSSITISMIGNDIGFPNKLAKCVADFDTCYSSYESRLEVMREIENKFSTLASMYAQLKSVSPHTKIYVVGYPQIFSTINNQCGFNVRLNHSEREFSRGLARYLNSMIKAAADYAGVVYVSVENAFINRQLCDGPQYVLAVNGLTAGNDKFKVIGNESYHPNPTGHTLMAESVMRQTKGLTIIMPAPDHTATAPNPLSDEFAEFLDVPRQFIPVRSIHYEDSLGEDVVVPGTSQEVSFPAPAPGEYKLWLNSEPIYLGSFEADIEDKLNLSYTVPLGMSAGFHTLHLYGKNLANEDIDIYKTVYIAADIDDYDGDGIPNDQDSCDAFENSGIDTDQDGIDDVCDSFINEPPITKTTEDPKPPVNNPETVAGNEELQSQHTATSTATTIPAQVDSSAPGTQQPPILETATQEAGPQVAAATNIARSDNKGFAKPASATPQETEKNNYRAIGAGLLLLPLGFVVIYRLVKPPRSHSKTK